MSSFTMPLCVICPNYRKNDEYFVLNEEFMYYTDDKARHIVVPKGFKTDFASVPRICWSVFPPYGRYAKAAVVHDFLCEVNHLQNGRETYNAKELLQVDYDVSRAYADKVFLEAMKVLGVNVFTRHLLYLGVRVYAYLFGIK